MPSFNLPNRPPQLMASYSHPPPPPLAPGWTEHKAPTGHSYYYNAATKASTYTRPVTPVLAPTPFAVGPTPGPYSPCAPTRGLYREGLPRQQFLNQHQSPPQQQFAYGQGRGYRGMGRGGGFNSQGPRSQHQKRQEKPDRPKSKQTIPGAMPWVLVTTKLGRKFVHNSETKVSLWKAPEYVQAAIDSMLPEDETMKKQGTAKTRVIVVPEKEGPKKEHESEARGTKRLAPAAVDTKGEHVENMGAEGEEDGGGCEDGDEGEDEEDTDGEEGHENKRLKTGEAAPSGPVEFTEDDIVWQLEAMAKEYGLDEEDLEEGEEMTEEENIGLFREMLHDYKINPYSTWDTEMPRIVEDTRYVLITTTKRRKEIFTEWCRERIIELKAEKEKSKKIDPKISFWAFLRENASTKLYWPEFKRKWKKVPEMKDPKLVDKEKEKMYRDYIAHIKTSESIRENDLKKLLKSTSSMCRSTPLDDIPESVLIDVRYITAPERIRDAIIRDHLATLPQAPVDEGEKKTKKEKERKERALRDRQTTVRKEQWKLRGDEQRAKDLLREEEAMVERAKIVGKKGLLGHIIKKEEGTGEEEETPELDEGGKVDHPENHFGKQV